MSEAKSRSCGISGLSHWRIKVTFYLVYYFSLFTLNYYQALHSQFLPSHNFQQMPTTNGAWIVDLLHREFKVAFQAAGLARDAVDGHPAVLQDGVSYPLRPREIKGVHVYGTERADVQLDLFHHLGAGKYESLGLDYPSRLLKPPSDSHMNGLARLFAERGLAVQREA